MALRSYSHAGELDLEADLVSDTRCVLPMGSGSAASGALESAHARGAITFALPGPHGSYAMKAATQDAFIHQELVEIFYHTLWETVHVFLEHRELGQDVGLSEFLYPFLGQKKQETMGIVDEVAASIQMKVHDDTLLRTRLAKEESEQIAATSMALQERLTRGVEFDWHSARHNIQAVRPGMRVFELSAKTGDGLDRYLDFLAERLAESRATACRLKQKQGYCAVAARSRDRRPDRMQSAQWRSTS